MGKFMPVHKGHLALIDFAATRCDELNVLLCHHAAEPIAGTQRMRWLEEILAGRQNINLIDIGYNPKELTDSSEANGEYAKAWAAKVKTVLPKVAVFFSSEAYGDAFAKHLGATHVPFDKARNIVPVSASLIRQKPLTHWDYLPRNVQPFFVQKVALLGSESTGKSTLAERLARHYRTAFVPEMAREVIGHTAECTEESLLRIATLHAQTIVQKRSEANRLLFCDTDLNVTKSYSRFLFGKELDVPAWIEEANRCHLYLFLSPDCPYVQDGTRLSEGEREALSDSHLEQLGRSGILYKAVGGGWEERFAQACNVIDEFLSEL